MHGMQLVQDLALIMTAAAVATVICQRLNQPVVLGYILAGVVIGPNNPWIRLVVNEEEIRTLAELGVILLMFSVGLHFSFRKLKEVGRCGYRYGRGGDRGNVLFRREDGKAFWDGARWMQFFLGRSYPFRPQRLLPKF